MSLLRTAANLKCGNNDNAEPEGVRNCMCRLAPRLADPDAG